MGGQTSLQEVLVLCQSSTPALPALECLSCLYRPGLGAAAQSAQLISQGTLRGGTGCCKGEAAAPLSHCMPDKLLLL